MSYNVSYQLVIKVVTVTPSKLTSANPVVSLAIHPVKSTCDQMDNRPYKNVKVNAKKGE
jgi:hypothetical protein